MTDPIPSVPRGLAAAALIAVLALATSAAAQQAPADPGAPPPAVQTDVPAPAAPQPEAAPSVPGVPPPAAPEDVAPQAGPAAVAAPAPSESPGAATTPAPPAGGPALSAPGGPAMPHDLSPIGMFRAAHWVVQAVMLSLAFACFVTWTVLLFKIVELFVAARRVTRSARIIRDGAGLAAVAAALGHRRDPAAFMARAALEEVTRSEPALAAVGPAGVKERVRSILDRVEVQAGKRLRRGTGVLATIGSTAPFVGLFGTVWGIMNSFIGIAETKSTNLAVVAPGIAEALLATAIGLVAAIPAVMIYNHFARSIASYRSILGDAGAGVERLVSRDLDFRAAGL